MGSAPRPAFLLVLALVLAGMRPAPAFGQNVTGTWIASSGGVYTITQSGTSVTWVSRDPAPSPAWVHNFSGAISGDIIEGDYVAVPPGQLRATGHLTLRVVDATHMTLVSATGAAFGSSSWTRQGPPPEPARQTVTGSWVASSGGVYTIVQSGNSVTWTSRDPAPTPAWVHDFTGTISGDIIEGDYVAVPPGHMRASGHLTLRVVDANHMVLVAKTGSDFASSAWTRQSQVHDNPPPRVSGILIEAESEMESGMRPLQERPAPNMKEIGPAWRPPYSGTGDWYLAVGGEFLRYRVDIPVSATYTMWIRDYADRFQARGVRRIIVEWDGRVYVTFGEVEKDAPGDRGVFGWHKVGGGVLLTAGTHTLKVTKEATTAGAAILDAFYLTPDPNDRPSEK
ncbi:MAG: hypothetical protein Q7J25_03310 [Vicinamibacterales bacterium]|nr:hypothetical protein [Vicinamibacterales bacterium]